MQGRLSDRDCEAEEVKVLDLCAGRLGISRVFAGRGHQVTAVDLVEPPEIPVGVTFIKADILTLTADWVRDNFDFGWASTPCEQFSLFGLPHFHPNPPFPAVGLQLFNHAKQILTDSGIEFCMENVKSAQDFVGRAVSHCGPFYLWGPSVPPLLPQGIKKGVSMGSGSAMKGMTREEKYLYRKQFDCLQVGGKSKARAEYTSQWATIPPELAHAICNYSERLLEQRKSA